MSRNLLHALPFVLVSLIAMLPIVCAANTYKVTPRVIDKEVKQRDIFSETITITNNMSRKINLYALVNEVDLGEGGDISSFSPRSVSDNTTTPTSWIQITRSRIELMPGKTKEIPVEFKVHPQAESGVYHVFIGFGEGTNQDIAKKQVKEGSAPGVIVTLSVDQEKMEFLKLGQFIVDRFVTKPDNEAITYTLNNPGTADLVPKGEIIFYDARGTEVAAVPVNPDNHSLAPGQETSYTLSAPTEKMFGKYKAFLSVDYGTENLASVYDTAFFVVVPWQKLIIIFGALMFVTILLTVLIHRRMVGDDEYHHDGAEDLPLFVRNSVSDDKDHDINLKQQ